jgi:acyl-coenzyme A synthetase/AMP-(fatty) acid ligase/aspartate oxidase
MNLFKDKAVTVLPDLQCEALVIGGGIAGAWCALKLAEQGITTIMITYQARDRGGLQGATTRSAGAINTSALSKGDFETQLERMGQGQVNPTIARIMQRHLAQELSDLERFASLTAIQIGVKPTCDSRTLLERIYSAFEASGGQVVDGWVTRLVADAGTCRGVQYENAAGIGRIVARHVVIASGGYASLFAESVQTANYGAMAGRFLCAGGTLANLEFVFRHGFGQPDTGSLTPTEELRGAAIVNETGEHVAWLEEAFFQGQGTHQHQRAAEFWRSHSHQNFYVQPGYRELFRTVSSFNTALESKDLDFAIDAARILIGLFPAAVQGPVQQRVTLSMKYGQPISYAGYAQIRAWYPVPQQPRQRIRHIPYFSMGGIAHVSCRTGLHQVYVTGEAMHDFGADRVGGLPWGLYLSCASHIRDQIVADRESTWRNDAPESFELVHARSRHDLPTLEKIRSLVHPPGEARFSRDRARRAVQSLRELRRDLRRNGHGLEDGIQWSILAEAILESTLARQESRGCFYREDFPAEDPNMSQCFTFTRYLPEEDRVIATLVVKQDYAQAVGSVERVTTESEIESIHHNAAFELVDRHFLAGRGDVCALLQPGRSPATYRELNLAAGRLARYLQERGVRSGQPVALLMPDSQEWAFTFVACLKLGAVAVPINFFAPAGPLTKLLRDHRNAVIVTSTHAEVSLSSLPVLSGAPSVIRLDEAAWREGSEYSTNPVAAEHPALQLYTSGTTGEPKAVVHTHAEILACVAGYPRDILEISPQDRCYSTSKCFFAYGLGNSILFPLAAGASVVLDPSPTSPDRVLQMLSEYSPSLFFSVPSVYQRLAEDEGCGREPFQNVRLCLSAGEYLPPNLFSRWEFMTGHRILDGIGTTEALHIFCSNSTRDLQPGTSGKPVAGYELRLLDENDQPVPDGTIGQLHLRGRTVAGGQGSWLSTGDLYRRNPEGRYIYAGRSGDSFKTRGMWVSSVELEQLLLGQSGVREVAVVPDSDANGLQVPKAFIVADASAAGPEGIDAWITSTLAAVSKDLPRYKVPHKIEVLTALPRTATGKVARHLLRARGNTTQSMAA